MGAWDQRQLNNLVRLLLLLFILEIAEERMVKRAISEMHKAGNSKMKCNRLTMPRC